MMTGTSASARSDCSSLNTAHPSISGMMTSSVMARGRRCLASASPSGPLDASTGVNPSRCRCLRDQLPRLRVVVDHEHLFEPDRPSPPRAAAPR